MLDRGLAWGVLSASTTVACSGSDCRRPGRKLSRALRCLSETWRTRDVSSGLAAPLMEDPAVLEPGKVLPSWGGNELRKAVEGVDTVVSRGVGAGGAKRAISGSYASSKSGK